MAVTNINDVPGLSEQYNTLVANPQTRNQAVALAKQAMADPVKYVEGTLSSTILNDNTLNNNFANTNKAIQFLKDNGVSAAEVKSSYEGALADAQRSLLEAQNRGGGFFEDVLSSPLTQIALAYYLPGVGEALGASLVSAGAIGSTYATAVGTALASTAVQVANGADFETALRDATVNAVVSTGSPTVANDIAKTFEGNANLADAITSGGASIASTIAKGGNMSEALSNAGAAIAASGASQLAKEGDLSQATSREIGATVGGALTGGATGAALGFAGEAGRPAAVGKGVQVAAAETEPGVVSDTLTDVGLVDILNKKDSGIGGTDVQVVDALRRQTGAETATPKPDVTITAAKQPSNIATTDIQTIDVVGKKIPTVTVTGSKEPAAIGGTDIQIEDPITDVPEEPAKPEEPAEPEEPGPRSTDIFVYGGSKSPSSLSKSLGTTFQAPYYPGTAAQGLTAERGAGEIEGTETGKKRKNVWNEASLRLKDALGL
jgi:hypothetical protein